MGGFFPRLAGGMVLLVLLALLPPPAEARRYSRQGVAFSGYVNFVSDYIFRGSSRTNGHQTVQADLGLNVNFYGTLRFGIWGSGLAGATSEIREYVRYTLPLPLVSLNFGTTRYRFPGAVNQSNELFAQNEAADIEEVQVGASASLLSAFRVQVSQYESRRSGFGDYSYTELLFNFPLGLSLSYGTSNSDTDEANLGIGYSFKLNRVTFGVTYHDIRSQVRTGDLDDIWLSLRSGDYEQEDVVFNIKARF